jgi:hypothetical protein
VAATIYRGRYRYVLEVPTSHSTAEDGVTTLPDREMGGIIPRSKWPMVARPSLQPDRLGITNAERADLRGDVHNGSSATAIGPTPTGLYLPAPSRRRARPTSFSNCTTVTPVSAHG